jgi:uncharacterized protein YeaO (DUF488 family)
MADRLETYPSGFSDTIGLEQVFAGSDSGAGFMDIRLKRAYCKPERLDGFRVLVDGLWPRGLSKDDLQLDGWLKELAPSAALRRWFGHDADRWQEFRQRYFAELDENPDLINVLLHELRRGRVTLVYGAREEKFNNAVALKDYLGKKLRQHAE